MATNLAQHLRLMLVTDDRLLAGRDPLAVCRQAVAGGVTAVQLRLKGAGARELLQLARRLKASLPVPILINDRPDLAAMSGCGVHLGPADLPLALARRVMAAGSILGASVGTEEEARTGQPADAQGGPSTSTADYWGVGPWRATGTKADAGAAIGAAGFRRVLALAGGIPCIAIGGVQPEDVPLVRAAGGVGVAVVSGILGSDDPEAAARRYAEAWR